MTSTATEPTVAERALPWVLRALWVAVLVAGGRAVDGALDDESGAASAVPWIGLAAWIVGVAAMAIPAVTTLTATRVIVPASVGVAAIAWLGGADPADSVIFLGVATLASIVATASGLGRAFVQASAYGDEDRHLLRPPLAYLLVAGFAWLCWISVGLLAAVATARAAWIWAVALWVLTVAGAVLGYPRWHRLTVRWLVLVPAGLVVHDHLVLAETLMLRRQEISGVGLAPAGTDAADLTGPAPGHAIEIRTVDHVAALLSATSGKPGGTKIHLSGFLVAPTRPGRVLAAASARRLPVGALA